MQCTYINKKIFLGFCHVKWLFLMQGSNKKGQWNPKMLIEASMGTTRLKQAGFSFSEFQEETDLDNNACFT